MKPQLKEKDILNPQEAIELFKLSRRKFHKLLKDRNNEFTALYGNRILIIRIAFEKYLLEHPEIRRREPKCQGNQD